MKYALDLGMIRVTTAPVELSVPRQKSNEVARPDCAVPRNMRRTFHPFPRHTKRQNQKMWLAVLGDLNLQKSKSLNTPGVEPGIS